MNQALQSGALPTQATRGYFQRAAVRVYTAADICRLARMSRRSFYAFKKQGQLPLFPVRQVGRVIRYQAGPIDRWLAGR